MKQIELQNKLIPNCYKEEWFLISSIVKLPELIKLFGGKKQPRESFILIAAQVMF